MTTFRCTAHNGELDFGSEFHQTQVRMFLLDNEGKQLLLTKPQTKRTLSQNNFYWFYLGVIEQETGNNADDLHEFFKHKLLPKKLIIIHGKADHELVVNKSTTELSKLEFTEYMDKISAMTGVPVPNPEDAGYVSN